ncbi:hypothetical protein [Paenibacillus vini]|uniref:Uncharacterized protein n=1 Tax=Paenibacillus vini TaxID=1476024 RepID=A0ABQ4MI05_9BACL|nr:hypothetical protein [Paenibacillus vini]GIP55045.1 hypothetical protein J42TS3_40800 [Paenibacillus vini]
MSDLEVRLQQIMTLLQGQVMDENHPLGIIFRKLGEMQSNTESLREGGADQETLDQYKQQIAALDLDEETQSELRSVFAETANGGGTAPSSGLNEQILSDLMKQLSHIQSLIRDPNVDPAAALSMIRPFYEEASAVVQNLAGSFNLNGSSFLASLQAMLKNQSR